MKVLDYSNPEREHYTIRFSHSLLWESALGIAAITHDKLRDTLTETEFYQPVINGDITIDLKAELEEVYTHNTWKALLQLLHSLEDHSLEGYCTFIRSLDTVELRRICLPYLNTYLEPLLDEAATGNAQAVEEYATASKHIVFLPDYVRYICHTDITSLKSHLISVMTGWVQQMITDQEVQLEGMICRDLSTKKEKHKTISDPIAFVHYVTDGIDYLPEPSVPNVLLIPHFSYRPWTIVADLKGTKVFYYPISNASIHPGDPLVPDRMLPLAYKALGDEARLKMVKLLFEGTKSLQELAITLDMPKSTLHHHLTQLRSARLISTNKSRYSLHEMRLQELGQSLTDYLSN
ncbi:ArsR/SmtB family transcription factor [Alkalicoccobacillus murimartini]|uniref:HTH arsR-type domain-containing protein n=1 Tax=Alkalicoccobacillus murimartini TaxID=171685 RepID=A0ABT9YIY4_9BACI|nr:metalloregulator ArsR/SmtB family transcription factor [Alkalicoccobacillus murimartini]MDQ0207832.1 hypothetical protein [Alkalicoccobacillus murimartini]